MTALLHQPTHATAELHWLAEQVRIETDQRNFGGSWRSLRAARSDRHDLADREGPTRTMADQGGVTEDSRRNGPHCGDLPTVVGAIWRTNVRTPAQHYRHPDPCMCDCSFINVRPWIWYFGREGVNITSLNCTKSMFIVTMCIRMRNARRGKKRIE